MKRLVYMLPLLLFACESPSNQVKANSFASEGEELHLLAKTSDITEVKKDTVNSDSSKSLEILKTFAEAYSPTKQPNAGIAKLPEAPDSVLRAISIVKASQPKEFERYLTLIFVKLYSAHLECCHQSFEIRKQPSRGLDKERDPLAYQFNTLTKKFPDDKPIELISSGIGYDYVKEHTYLLRFEPIQKQVTIIEQIQKNIEDGVYWK
ncbi:MAG: hypothetical protein ACOH13_09850 [Flavobacteriales bacterium]